jgi:signal transduction histidine kinase
MNYFALSALINALVSLLLGFYALRKGYKKPLNSNYALLAFSVALWSGGYFFWQISATAAAALFWCRVLMAGAILIPVLDFNFTLWLTNKYHEKRFASFLSYFIGGAFLASNFAPLIVAGVAKKLYFEFWPLPGPLFPLFLLMFFSYAVYSLLIMFSVFGKSTGQTRSQLFYVIIGTIIGYAGGSINYLLWYDIPVPPVTNVLALVFPLLLVYAITKHRLMDISVVISRAAAEFLATLFLGAGYLFFVWLYRAYVSTKLDVLFVSFSVLYGIFVEQVYPTFRIFFQTTSDKLFLHGKYDYYQALSDASSKVGGKLALPDILKVLYYTFSDVVEISNPRIFLSDHFSEADKVSDEYVIYDKATFLPQAGGQRIKIADPLVKELIAKREPLHEVKLLNAVLVVPCLLEDRLIAFFALGPKLSEDPYTDEDLRMLKTLANQVAITLDHTRSYEKIKADLEVAEIQLERSERLASLGTLTAGVTHEIRNPLTVIRAETERLANQERDLEYLKQFRSLVVKHIDRISGIVQRMLQLAKEKEKQEVDVRLDEMIETTLQFFTISRLSVKTDLQPVPPIKGDPEALQEVFVNLIQNALDAMGDKGELALRTYKDDGHVVAEVSDTGKGIPEEIREKIFDPFYSTRHEGVGLGLSIVHRIVREHGGSIKVESQVGKGTTFKLQF